jgi:hypothetical protein
MEIADDCEAESCPQCAAIRRMENDHEMVALIMGASLECEGDNVRSLAVYKNRQNTGGADHGRLQGLVSK